MYYINMFIYQHFEKLIRQCFSLVEITYKDNFHSIILLDASSCGCPWKQQKYTVAYKAWKYKLTRAEKRQKKVRPLFKFISLHKQLNFEQNITILNPVIWRFGFLIRNCADLYLNVFESTGISLYAHYTWHREHLHRILSWCKFVPFDADINGVLVGFFYGSPNNCTWCMFIQYQMYCLFNI